jgi:hypothetical protein
MHDPRWGDPRERDDGRARVYDERDRTVTDHDPRDGLMHDLDQELAEVHRDSWVHKGVLVDVEVLFGHDAEGAQARVRAYGND